jgi:sigma-B regulation protein RsbU (phosphoserine phosphatase)
VNSGHNPPFILRDNGNISYLKVGGMPLGFFEDLEYKEFSDKLNNEDLLILFTDGFEEAESPNNEFLGKENFINICKSYKKIPVKELIENIFNDVKVFTNNKIEDDWTAVGLRYVK